MVSAKKFNNRRGQCKFVIAKKILMYTFNSHKAQKLRPIIIKCCGKIKCTDYYSRIKTRHWNITSYGFKVSNTKYPPKTVMHSTSEYKICVLIFVMPIDCCWRKENPKWANNIRGSSSRKRPCWC